MITRGTTNSEVWFGGILKDVTFDEIIPIAKRFQTWGCTRMCFGTCHAPFWYIPAFVMLPVRSFGATQLFYFDIHPRFCQRGSQRELGIFSQLMRTCRAVSAKILVSFSMQ